MPRENNFLLGRGELLTSGVSINSGGGSKNPPYDFDVARQRISRKLEIAEQQFEALPVDACPKDQVVAMLTMHPRYLSKSDFPEALFKEVGLRALGSRTQQVIPESWGVTTHPEAAFTEAYFVVGARDNFSNWSHGIQRWEQGSRIANDLTHV